MIPKRSLQRRPAQHAIPDNPFIDNNHNGVDDRMETMQSYQQHATSYQQPVDEPRSQWGFHDPRRFSMIMFL